MTVFTPFIYLSFILLALFIRPYLLRSIINYPLILTIIGFAAAVGVVITGHDRLIHYGYFQNLVKYFIIPVIIYHSAMTLDYKIIRENKLNVFLLGIALSLFTIFLGGYLLFLFINNTQQFPLVAGILTMALLVSTTSTTFREWMSNNKRIYAILQAETLCTQLISVVCFSTILITTFNQTTNGSWLTFGIAQFCDQIAGGLFVALMVGGLTIGLININRDLIFQSVVTVFAIYLGYLLAIMIFKVSGVVAIAGMAVLFTVIGNWIESPPTHIFIDKMWESLYAICYAATYLLLGATVTIWMFTQQYLAMLIVLAIVFGLRAIICYLMMPRGHKNICFLGGVRGLLPILLTLAIPSTLPYWWTIQSIVCGVVVLSLVVQLPMLRIATKGDAK